jgi:hypothetical protein
MDIQLPGIFHCRVKVVQNENGENTFAIDTDPLPKGIEFSVLYFSHVNGYWLVGWRQGNPEKEFYTGETLWKDSKPLPIPLTSGGGTIPLYKSPEVNTAPSKTPETPPSVWDRLDSRIGMYGLSMTDAIALQDPTNRTFLRNGLT